MNDDAKMVGQTVPPVAQVNQPQVQPVIPVGSPNKEMGPIDGNKAEPGGVDLSGAELNHEISQELKELGVEEKKDRPDLTFEHKELGVDHAGPSVPVSTTPIKVIQYPMSEEEVGDKLKTGQDDDSGKGLAKLIQKVIKAMGF